MFCTTECWICEDKSCKHYISKQALYFENTQLKEKIQWYEKENKHNQEIIIKDTSVLKEIRECIMSFLLTEEYIIVDGKAIANNYHELLEIIDKGIKK